MRPFQIAVLIALLAGVAGCALPPALTIASFVADGISMASSGKTVTDQAISLLARKDCRLWRLMQGKSICGADTSVVAVAALPPRLPLHAASPALRPAESGVAAAGGPVEVPPGEATPTPVAQIPAAMPPGPSPEPLPATSSSPVATVTPAPASPRPRVATAASRQTPPPNKAVAPPALPPMRHAAGDTPVHGEMIIRSGTDEAEARALADSLHAVGASVRPVLHGDVTIYEVVMGLSG
jgi:hypothetical protein